MVKSLEKMSSFEKNGQNFETNDSNFLQKIAFKFTDTFCLTLNLPAKFLTVYIYPANLPRKQF